MWYHRTMMTYEIEIKSLLGEQENADVFRNTIIEKGAKKTSENSQLNHYFIPGDFNKLLSLVQTYLSPEHNQALENIIEKGSDFSIRTREVDGKVKLVIKASVDNTTSDNGIARMEFEENLPLTLGELDQILIDAGFKYQAKWSRIREEYILDDITICLDKNAGYGWLTEFEKVIKEGDDRHQAEETIRALMDDCRVTELDQERLARMFDYYNNNWQKYYGTDNIFTLE